jgi:uncharacterized protein YggL (DUF469 family)
MTIKVNAQQSRNSTRCIRRLNRRQRKKFHLGEFQELMFSLRWTYHTILKEPEVYQFFDQFISMIEARNLSFGGGFGPEGGDGYVATLKRGTVSPEDRIPVLDWLRANPAVASADAGDLVDSWYGWESDDA